MGRGGGLGRADEICGVDPVYFATLALAVDRQSAVARPGPVLVVATLAYAGLALALFAQALAGLPVIAL